MPLDPVVTRWLLLGLFVYFFFQEFLGLVLSPITMFHESPEERCAKVGAKLDEVLRTQQKLLERTNTLAR